MIQKILFSNIGYAKGIDGSLWQHICRVGRHLYCEVPVQEQVMAQLKSIITAARPDLCCLVEVDQGSLHSGYYNQLQALLDDEYCHHDIADKYGPNSWRSKIAPYKGKSNAFLARHALPFEKLYFQNGTKRLLYRIFLPNGVQLFFAHFSLQAKTRAMQFREMNELVRASDGDVIILADFNIMQGFSELKPLLEGTDLKILNREDESTFVFHRHRLTLDLCICSQRLAETMRVQVIPQPFSDHAALLVEV